MTLWVTRRPVRAVVRSLRSTRRRSSLLNPDSRPAKLPRAVPPISRFLPRYPRHLEEMRRKRVARAAFSADEKNEPTPVTSPVLPVSLPLRRARMQSTRPPQRRRRDRLPSLRDFLPRSLRPKSKRHRRHRDQLLRPNRRRRPARQARRPGIQSNRLRNRSRLPLNRQQPARSHHPNVRPRIPLRLRPENGRLATPKSVLRGRNPARRHQAVSNRLPKAVVGKTSQLVCSMKN